MDKITFETSWFGQMSQTIVDKVIFLSKSCDILWQISQIFASQKVTNCITESHRKTCDFRMSVWTILGVRTDSFLEICWTICYNFGVVVLVYVRLACSSPTMIKWIKFHSRFRNTCWFQSANLQKQFALMELSGCLDKGVFSRISGLFTIKSLQSQFHRSKRSSEGRDGHEKKTLERFYFP